MSYLAYELLKCQSILYLVFYFFINESALSRLGHCTKYNQKYKAVDCKSSRLVYQEVSDLWRATTPDTVNISDNFSQREFTVALQHLKPDKDPGPDSICSELIFHAGAALKSWLRDFLSSCLRQLKIKIWRRALVVAIPKPTKPMGDPELSADMSALCPLQDPREAYLCPRSTINQSTAP